MSDRQKELEKQGNIGGIDRQSMIKHGGQAGSMQRDKKRIDKDTERMTAQCHMDGITSGKKQCKPEPIQSR